MFVKGMTLSEALDWYRDLCESAKVIRFQAAREQNAWDRENLANRIIELGGSVPEPHHAGSMA